MQFLQTFTNVYFTKKIFHFHQNCGSLTKDKDSFDFLDVASIWSNDNNKLSLVREREEKKGV